MCLQNKGYNNHTIYEAVTQNSFGDKLGLNKKKYIKCE